MINIRERLYIGFHWHVWYLSARGRFIAQQWSFTVGPVSVSFYDSKE